MRSRVQDGTRIHRSATQESWRLRIKVNNIVPNSLVKDALQVALGQSGTLKVFVRLDLLSTGEGLLVRHGLHALLAERVKSGGVLTKIELGADEDDGDIRSMVIDLGIPLESCMLAAVALCLRTRPTR